MNKSNLCEAKENFAGEPASRPPQGRLASAESYTINGRRFDVERVFREDAHNTIGTVLLKLIQIESETP